MQSENHGLSFYETWQDLLLRDNHAGIRVITHPSFMAPET
jgi:hypothetical protein